MRWVHPFRAEPEGGLEGRVPDNPWNDSVEVLNGRIHCRWRIHYVIRPHNEMRLDGYDCSDQDAKSGWVSRIALSGTARRC
jgi:hypothetical protein